MFRSCHTSCLRGGVPGPDSHQISEVREADLFVLSCALACRPLLQCRDTASCWELCAPRLLRSRPGHCWVCWGPAHHHHHSPRRRPGRLQPRNRTPRRPFQVQHYLPQCPGCGCCQTGLSHFFLSGAQWAARGGRPPPGGGAPHRGSNAGVPKGAHGWSQPPLGGSADQHFHCASSTSPPNPHVPHENWGAGG